MVLFYLEVFCTSSFGQGRVVSPSLTILRDKETGDKMLEINGHQVPEHVSYSSLTTWLNCGWQYYLGRIAKVDEQPAIWNLGGSAVHKATEIYDLELWETEKNV